MAVGEGFHSSGGPILGGHTMSYWPSSAAHKVITRDLLSGRGIVPVVPPSLRVGHATEFRDIAEMHGEPSRNVAGTTEHLHLEHWKAHQRPFYDFGWQQTQCHVCRRMRQRFKILALVASDFVWFNQSRGGVEDTI